MTSFIRSTKALPPRLAGTDHKGAMAWGSSTASGTAGAGRRSTCAAASAPLRKADASPNTPAAAPALALGCAGRSGTNPAMASFQRKDPRDCECRCTAGVQPPETASRSQEIRRSGPPATGATSTPVTLRRPSTRST